MRIPVSGTGHVTGSKGQERDGVTGISADALVIYTELILNEHLL